ncbi:MAG: carbonic anhydrase [Candidatus Kryptonium sp.]
MTQKFATAINCMDGRTQIPIIEWLRENYKVEYVDMITEPGPDGVLSRNVDNQVIESLKRKAEISAYKHNSKIIVIAGHHDCAGNPVDKDTHINQIKLSVQAIKSWGLPFEKVIGLWVNENWEIEKIVEI